ncbi:MAG TPA: hypothetical protein VE081_10860 [Sporichthyaceae bacterium]|nr:hypothetical protein [Sporichthyaceae bacterium]
MSEITTHRAGDPIAGALLALATAAGLILGLAGPSTSPVAPGSPPVAVIAGLTNRLQGIPPGAVANTAPGRR